LIGLLAHRYAKCSQAIFTSKILGAKIKFAFAKNLGHNKVRKGGKGWKRSFGSNGQKLIVSRIQKESRMETETIVAKEQPTRIKEVDYDTVLKVYVNSYIGCIAAKYCNNNIVGMEYDDLCQDGRQKLWDFYSKYVQNNPEARIDDFVREFKAAFTNLCKDVQRRYYFSEKRCVNKVVDLTSAMESMEQDHQSALENLPDPKQDFGVLDLEVAELMSDLKTRLTPLESQLLEQLVNPRSALQALMIGDRVIDYKHWKIVHPPKGYKKSRFPSKPNIDQLAVVLQCSYDEASEAMKHLKDVVARRMAKLKVYVGRRNSSADAAWNRLNWAWSLECPVGRALAVNR